MTDVFSDLPDLAIALGTDPASVAMGVRPLSYEPTGVLTYRQRVVEWQRDERPGPTLSSLGVLVDAAIGSAAYIATHGQHLEFVVSRLAVSMAPWTSMGTEVTAEGRAQHVDDATGTVLATGTMQSDGQLLATLTCRSVAARRPRDSTTTDTDHGVAQDDREPIPTMPDSPEPARPLAHLALGDPATGPDTYSVAWQTIPWMTNGLGSVQGGVLLCCADAVTHRVARAALSDDVESTVLDLSLDIMASPLVSETTTHRWESRVLRQGRRLTVISSDLLDDEGRHYAHATATVVARPR